MSICNELNEALEFFKTACAEPKMIVMSPNQFTLWARECGLPTSAGEWVACDARYRSVRIEIARKWKHEPTVMNEEAMQDYFDRRFAYTGSLRRASER